MRKDKGADADPPHFQTVKKEKSCFMEDRVTVRIDAKDVKFADRSPLVLSLHRPFPRR